MSEDLTHDVSDPGITITRVFEAPREQVWREWTEPEAFADWFGGVEAEVPLASVSMQVEPGGAWRATMFAGAERQEIHWRGAYREVVEPERLVFTITDQPGDEYALIVVDLTDLGDGRTEMQFEQHGPSMAPEEYERAAQGWSKFFDHIAERLAAAAK
jgi:uncharacterized protein YndB with AHSA1/START domain